MTIKQAADIAYEVYEKLEPNGRQQAAAASLDFLLAAIPHGKYPEFDDHFGQAGKLAAQGITIEYQPPQAAVENDELTAALRNMRAVARHNFGGNNE